MFWSVKENAGGLKHMWKGLTRALFRVPSTRPFETLKQKSDKIRILVDDENQPVNCKACGYAIVRFTYADGWEVEACSAVTAPKLVNNQNFDNWVDAVISGHRVKSEVR